MFAAILSWLGSFLSGPAIKAGIDLAKTKIAADDDAEKMRVDLAGRELLLQQRELELQSQLRIAEIGKWYEPEHLMGYAVVIYFGKLLIWDKVLGWGSTDPLAGWAATTANLIVVFYFGKRGFENIARIIKR